MNGDDQFEARLRRHQQRQIPPGWRAEILSAAREARSGRRSSPVTYPSLTYPSLLSTLSHQLSAMLWPHPKAWAALAVVWMLVLGLDFAAQEPSTQEIAREAGPPSLQLRQMLRQQEQMLAELEGPIDRPDAPLPKAVVPQPRSERRKEFRNA